MKQEFMQANRIYRDRIELNNELYSFTFHTPVSEMKNLALGIPGLHNVENACAACAVAWQLGVGEDQEIQGVVVSNGLFNTLYKGIIIGTATPVGAIPPYS